MLKVGITGGIGSGKSTVCSLFAVLGIPVYYADIRAKEIMVSDHEVIQALTALLGPEVYLQDGSINRKWMAEAIFHDAALLQKVNAIVHPAVFQDTIDWFQSHMHHPYCLYEAAIMFESGSYKMMDKMITVFAPLEDRIARTMARDGISREAVLERIDKQLPEEEKISRADYVIYNDHTRLLTEQVLTIHRELILLNKGN